MTTLTIAVDRAMAYPPSLAGLSLFGRLKKEADSDHFTGREIVREDITNEHGSFTRVAIEWWGVDTSGHFPERHSVMGRHYDFEEVPS